MKYTFKIYDIIDSFMVHYDTRNKDIQEIRSEIMDISKIPDASEGKRALKQDFNNFLRDAKKVEKEIKEELCNG